MIKFFLFISGLLFLSTGFTEVDNSDFDSPDFNISYSDNIEGSVSGNIVIPVKRKTGRRFRGSSYRNRGSSSSANSTKENGTSSYERTIISAHPISYDLPDDISGETVQIGQENATFIPNVTPVTVGTVVQFINDDPFFHNVFSLTPGSKFNIGRRPTGDVYSKEIEAPKWKVTGVGPISLFCDVHAQMNATILSLDTPYFTRLNEDGNYNLSGLPEGRYELRIFNPEFEIISEEIVIENGVNKQKNFNLSS